MYNVSIKELVTKEWDHDPQWDPLWEYAKYVFDMAAKMPKDILCGLDSVYNSLEDFCKKNNITPSPLCAFMFEGRGCFLAIPKQPRYHAKEWNEMFPEQLRKTFTELPAVLAEYKRFLEERDDKFDYEALSFLADYEESPDPFDDDM